MLPAVGIGLHLKAGFESLRARYWNQDLVPGLFDGAD
jgi:hypothetical protein